MNDKDPSLPPGSKLSQMIRIATDFVAEYYDQNPISHLGVVTVRDGEAEMLTRLSGSPRMHVREIAKLSVSGGAGEFSLQNGLELAGRSLGHMPPYGSREIVLVCGALSTCDPGDLIVETLPRLKKAKIRVSTIAMCADMYICRRLAEETGGTIGVCLNTQHFRELFMMQCVPPPSSSTSGNTNHGEDGSCESSDAVPHKSKKCDFISMGFPTRESGSVPCLIHATKDKKLFSSTGYECPRCKGKVSELPTDCPVCGLKLVLAPHLARSFHHLFPVPPFVEKHQLTETPSWKKGTLSHEMGSNDTLTTIKPDDIDGKLLISSSDSEVNCYACLKYIGPPPPSAPTTKKKKRHKHNSSSNGISKISEPCINVRLECTECLNIFCADCDAYLHETLHNCPGCLCKNT